MHHCLQILEIVELICSHLDPGDFECEPGHLAALARACTSLRDPALDLLWRNQNLVNILRCFPTDLWDPPQIESSEGSAPTRMELLRPIVPEDWNRPRIYASRVRELSFDSPILMAHILPAISVCLPGGLFSDLHSLRWDYSHFDPSHIPLFLGPQLVKIDLYYSRDCSLSLLSTLAHDCPMLKEISIVCDDGDRLEFLGAMNMLVPDLQVVMAITTHALSWETLEHVGRIASFASLELRELPLRPSSYPGARMFTGLRKLTIWRTPMQRATDFFCLCRGAPLDSILLRLPGTSTLSETRDFFCALATGCAHSALTTLDLLIGDAESWPEPDTEFVSSGTIQLLLCFVNLTDVHIKSPAGFDLDDGTVCDMARSWPRLERLRFTSFDTPERFSGTLRGLQSFAQYCPRLELIELAFDASEVPSPEDPPPTWSPQQSLHTLHAPMCPLTAPAAVARFLAALFPNLRTIITDRTGLNNSNYEALVLYADEIAIHSRWMMVLEALGDGHSALENI
ncbi:hypothetical protein FB451DRAFT_1142284 [Mycena latifolia]|nr:hypothetical protein FB451DRAFT_1142284 [Mycena latifolia]